MGRDGSASQPPGCQCTSSLWRDGVIPLVRDQLAPRRCHHRWRRNCQRQTFLDKISHRNNNRGEDRILPPPPGRSCASVAAAAATGGGGVMESRGVHSWHGAWSSSCQCLRVAGPPHHQGDESLKLLGLINWENDC